MRNKKLLLFLICGLAWSHSFAQKYNIKTYTVNDGLPSSQVYDVHLDDNGFVWFATAYGLVRFEGYEFETYGEEHGLRDELIYDIFEDSQKRFWVSTETGGVGELVSDSVIYNEQFSVLDTMLINFITESPEGELWFGTDLHGLMIWDGESFESLTVKEGMPSNTVWDIWFDSAGSAWVSTMKGVVVYNSDKELSGIWNHEKGLSGEISYQVFEDSEGKLWIATSNGITILKEGRILKTITEINGEPVGYVYNVSQDDDGVIWIGTERNGLYWCKNGEYTHITKQNGLSSNYIYRLIKARDGTIWVATDGNGVSIFKDKKFQFYDYESGFGANSVFGVHKERNGTIWFGTENGISRFKNGNFKPYKIPESLFDEDEIWDIEQLPNGNLLMLSYDYQVLEFDGRQFFKSKLNDELWDYYISDFLVEEDGEIWVAHSRGVLRYKNGNITELVPSDEYWKSYVTMIFKDSKGNIWLGTEGGVAKYDGKQFMFYTPEEGLSGESIYEIKEDSRGNIWVGTDKGISVLKNSPEEGQTVSVQSFRVEEEFLPETISLLFDEKGGLWQGTNAGLNYYDVENWYQTGEMRKAHFFLQDYGLGVEFNGASAVIDEEGDIWFGTAHKGLLKYNFDSGPVITESRPPATFIRRLYADQQLAYSQSDDQKNSSPVILEYDKNNLAIDFGAVNYKDPERIFYRFKLEGFDEEWNYGFERREAFYTNLEPGNYTFMAMARTAKSDWPVSAATLEIKINQPFWSTWWFILFCIIFVIGLVVFYVQIYMSITEKKKLKILVDEQTKDLQKALEEKEVLIKEIHHRVKNNMAVISGLLELQSWNMQDGAAKNTIEDSKLRIKTMSTIHEKLYQNHDLANVDFKEFAEDLVKNISNSLKASDKDISVKMDIDNIQLNVNLAIPCGLILNEILCNSYEHAFVDRDSGTIAISFFKEEEKYKLSVSDDGKGITENILESDRSSLGLTLIKSLTSQVKGVMEISNKTGTRVDISIPVY